jgi:hypothetical protein
MVIWSAKLMADFSRDGGSFDSATPAQEQTAETPGPAQLSPFLSKTGGNVRAAMALYKRMKQRRRKHPHHAATGEAGAAPDGTAADDAPPGGLGVGGEDTPPHASSAGAGPAHADANGPAAHAAAGGHAASRSTEGRRLRPNHAAAPAAAGAENLYSLHIELLHHASDLPHATIEQVTHALWDHSEHIGLWIDADQSGHRDLQRLHDGSSIVAGASDMAANAGEGASHFYHWVKEVTHIDHGEAKKNESQYADKRVALPDLEMWQEPKAALRRAETAIGEHRVEAAITALNEAAAAYRRCHRRVQEYRERSESGAGNVIAGLRIAEAAGAISFSVMTGGMGSGVLGVAAASAAGAGVYGAGQLGVEQLTEKHVGLRQNLDFKAMLAKGAEDAAMTFTGALVGGALTKMFLGKLGRIFADRLPLAELERIAAKAGYKAFTPELFVSKGWTFLADLAGGIGSTPVTVAVSTALQGLKTGHWPSTDEFVDTVVHEVIQGGALQVLLGAVTHAKVRKAATEGTAKAPTSTEHSAPTHASAGEGQAAKAAQSESAKTATSEAHASRVKELHGSDAFKDSSFHGTNSELLDGLSKTDGQLVSAAELKRRGLKQSTGEGSSFSPMAGEKDFVSVGQGEAGLGTASAYAEAARSLNHYNVKLYSAAELKEEIGRLRYIVKHYEKLKIELPDMLIAYKKDKGQLAEQLVKLEHEAERRAKLPRRDPGRNGGAASLDNYPVLFEFDASGLTTEVTHGGHKAQALAGEASIRDPIDLKTRMKRAYCPQENVAELKSRLQGILGHGDFEVISIESLQHLPSEGITQGTHMATYKALSELQAAFVQVQKSYASALKAGVTVNVEWIFQKIKD